MRLDLEQIKQNYANFEDYKLEHLAKNEAGSLEPEVIPILMRKSKSEDLIPTLRKELKRKHKNYRNQKLLD